MKVGLLPQFIGPLILRRYPDLYGENILLGLLNFFIASLASSLACNHNFSVILIPTTLSKGYRYILMSDVVAVPRAYNER